MEKSIVLRDGEKMTMESFVFFCVITAILIGIILFICSAITVWRYSDEVEALVLGLEEWKPEYKSYADGMDAHRSQRVPTGHTFVRYKYKGLVMKTKVKSFWLWEGAKIKVRVNPKKPNECCMPRPRLGGLIGCWIFSAFWLYMCFYTL